MDPEVDGANLAKASARAVPGSPVPVPQRQRYEQQQQQQQAQPPLQTIPELQLSDQEFLEIWTIGFGKDRTLGKPSVWDGAEAGFEDFQGLC